jgi:hypothetical protein
MRLGLLSAVAASLVLAGCAKKDQATTEAAPLPVSKQDGSAPAASTFTAVDQSLKAGSFDDAAARLLEMRTVRSDFTPQEAAEYRRKLNEAYTAALEAAEKGDPRAKAAIEMIRANPGR